MPSFRSSSTSPADARMDHGHLPDHSRALTNAIKHSHSRRVRITVANDSQRIRLEVRDWGIGFSAKPPSRGVHGLRGLKERVRLLNGTFHLQSAKMKARSSRSNCRWPRVGRREGD